MGSTAKEYNKGSWQNQYCYRTDVLNDKTSVTTTSYSVGACPGGKYSKQSYALRYPATGPTSANSGYYIYKGGDAAYLRCTGGEGSRTTVTGCDATTAPYNPTCATAEACQDLDGADPTEIDGTTHTTTDAEAFNYYWNGTSCVITDKGKCYSRYYDAGYLWEDLSFFGGITGSNICGMQLSSPIDPANDCIGGASNFTGLTGTCKYTADDTGLPTTDSYCEDVMLGDYSGTGCTFNFSSEADPSGACAETIVEFNKFGHSFTGTLTGTDCVIITTTDISSCEQANGNDNSGTCEGAHAEDDTSDASTCSSLGNADGVLSAPWNTGYCSITP